MITRPLDLAARLRPEPRTFDWVFYVNCGLLALFFSLFGSRFVLAPGVGLLPSVAGAEANARPVTHHITVVSARQIFAGDGLRSLPQLRTWLAAEARTVKTPVLLVQSRGGVELAVIADIMSIAQECGFAVQLAAVEPARSTAPAPGLR